METKKYYVCSPLRADAKEEIQKNMEKARWYAEQIEKHFDFSVRAYAVHGYLPMFLNDSDPIERDLALSFGIKILENCDYLVICGDVISSGMQNEINYAKENNIPVLRFDEVVPNPHFEIIPDFSVNLPKGTLTVSKSDPEYPGILVDYINQNNVSIPICNVESENGILRLFVFGDPVYDYPTDVITFDDIDAISEDWQDGCSD